MRRVFAWRNWLPDVSTAAARFPLAVALAAALTLYKLYLGSDIGDRESRILEALGASFLWVVAVDFFAEARRGSPALRGAGWSIGIAAIALFFALQWQIWANPLLLFAGLAMLLGLSASLARRQDNAAFWMFNHRLWLGGAFALLGACLLGAGLSLTLETLNFLFALHLPQRWHEHIWSIALCFVAPVSFLSFAPKDLNERALEGPQTEFTAVAVATIVKFVLVPLLLVYTGILYAYLIKIAVEGELPKGTLGSMIVGYLLTGAATLLLAFPTRESGGLLVRLFWRYWVWLAVIPVLLLFLAVYTRIAAYGLTEERYLIVLIGVWALMLALLRIWQGARFDLRLVPLVLALLVLAVSFGTWGAIGASVASQKAELAKLLGAKGLLVDGKIVPVSNGNKAGLLGADAARVRGIEWYLNAHHALGVLAPWFEGHTPNPFEAGKSPEQTAGEIFAALGLRGDIPASPNGLYFNHYSDNPTVVSVAGGGALLGPIVFEGAGVSSPIAPQSVEVKDFGAVQLTLADNFLTVRIADGTELRFNLLDGARELTNPLSNEHRALRLDASSGEVSGILLIDNLNGVYGDPDVKITLMRFWLVLAKAQ